MFYLGKVIEYDADRGYGYLSKHHSEDSVIFYIAEFPREGGPPKKGENIKYMMVNDTADRFKAQHIIRLDIAVSEQLKHKKANLSKQKNILKKSKNDAQKLGFVSIVILVIFSGLVYFTVAAWNQYKNYQGEQSAKFALLEQQQKQIIAQQRKEIGYVKPVIFSDQSKEALNENAESASVEIEKVAVTANQARTTQPTKNTSSTSTTPKLSNAAFKCDGREHCGQMNSYEEAVFFIQNCPNTKMDGDHDGIPCENDSRW